MSETFATAAERAARAACGLLGWSPDGFWRATPAELRTALVGRFGGGDDGAGLGRDELGALMERFPDGR